MYDHFSYSESICKALKPFDWSADNQSFFRATEQTELHELNSNISNAAGMILIAINPAASSFLFQNSDSLMRRVSYSMVIVEQTSSSDTDTIFNAQAHCEVTAVQVISRIMCDARNYLNGCDLIDPDSFAIEGIGPIGDYFYGVMLHYDAVLPVNFKPDKSLWNVTD